VSDAPPPLPGGYKVGEKVFFTGTSKTFPGGDKLVHGQQGEVTGPANSEAYKGIGVCLRFPGNNGDVNCSLTSVRRLRAASAATPRLRPTHATLTTPRAFRRQPLPRRPSPHCMRSRSHRSPQPGCGRDGGRGRGAGCDRFGGSAREGGGRALYLLTPYGWWLRAQVSRDAPLPLPGGYKLGEKVFFTGRSKTFLDGDKVVHGQQGEVMGPATSVALKGKGVCVLFPGNMGNVNCYLTSVRRLRAASATTLRLRPPHTRDAAHAPRARPPSLDLALPCRPDPSCKPPWPSAPGARRSRMVRGGCGSAGEGPGQASPPLAFGGCVRR